MSAINIGIIGAGTVGGGLIKLFQSQKDSYKERLKHAVRIKRIVDKNVSLFDSLPVGDAQCSQNADDIINDDEIDIVVELVGGTGFAKELILKALQKKKHVVTANKALLAKYGAEIFKTAEGNNISVSFEASVGGAMPVIKTVREALAGDEILSIRTIINGTCNYILTRMEKDRISFKEALKIAQDMGFAEADPDLDINGGDTAHKIAILASLVSNRYVRFDDLSVTGITSISSDDIKFAGELGYRIKLLGIIKRDEHSLDIRIHPAMLPQNHILSSVSDEFNAVLIEGRAAGPVLLYGKGAGEMPTASAVAGDIFNTARNITNNTPKRIPMDRSKDEEEVTLSQLEKIKSRYYLRFNVVDRPNVLGPIASILGEHSISLASIIQKEGSDESYIPVTMLTHPAKEKNVNDSVSKIDTMDFIKFKTQIIRIED